MQNVDYAQKWIFDWFIILEISDINQIFEVRISNIGFGSKIMMIYVS